jgi:hypothetical protein
MVQNFPKAVALRNRTTNWDEVERIAAGDAAE